MRSPRLMRRLLLGVVDLTLLGVACWITVEAVRDIARGGWLSGLGAAIALICIAPASAWWLQVRLAPAIFALAKGERREQLALTLIPARTYLVSRLARPYVRTLAPGLVATLVIGAAFLMKRDWDSMPLAGLSLSAMALSTAGLFDLLVRECRRGKGSALPFLTPIAWGIVSVALPAGLLCARLDDLWKNAASLALAIFSAAFARSRWRRACEVYYRFD